MKDKYIIFSIKMIIMNPLCRYKLLVQILGHYKYNPIKIYHIINPKEIQNLRKYISLKKKIVLIWAAWLRQPNI